jgi:hypothetical protein
MSSGFTGGCHCGAVKYESNADPILAGHCHCNDCRKLSGTGHCTNMVVPKEAFSVSGDLTFYEYSADSGNTVSRGFCPKCGSAVYSNNSSMAEMVFPRASSLDDPEVAKPAVTVYASRAVPWDQVDPNIPSFPEMPEGGPQAIIEASQGVK